MNGPKGRDQVAAQVGAQVSPQVAAQVRDQVWDQARAAAWGQHDASWLAFGERWPGRSGKKRRTTRRRWRREAAVAKCEKCGQEVNHETTI